MECCTIQKNIVPLQPIYMCCCEPDAQINPKGIGEEI